MKFLNESNMVNGNVIPASDVRQIVDALSYNGQYDIAVSGSVSIGTAATGSNAVLYVSGNAAVVGGYISGNFSGSGIGITGVVTSSYAVSCSTAISSSYALTASYAMNLSASGSLGFVTTSSFNSFTSSIDTFTSSYYVTSASFDSRIKSITGSGAGTGFSIQSGSMILQIDQFGNLIASGSSLINFQVTGSGSFTGPVTANTFYQSSLKALKENIKEFSGSAVDIINSLDIVSYNYKKHTDFKIGIIADDSHEYIATKDHNVLDTSNSIGLLFKAIQELSEEIKLLKKKLKDANKRSPFY